MSRLSFITICRVVKRRPYRKVDSGVGPSESNNNFGRRSIVKRSNPEPHVSVSLWCSCFFHHRGIDDVINEPNGRVITTEDNEAYCKSASGEIRKLQWLNSPTTYEKISKSQLDWSLQNLDFIRSLTDKYKARQYVVAHLPK